MIGKESSPGLRRRGAPLRDQAGDGALGHVETKLQEFAVDARRAPERVRGGHPRNQSSDLGMDGRATSGRAARELGPVFAEAAPCQRRTVFGVTITRGCL